MASKDVDILISGGGVAGLVAAVAFGKAGFQVFCVDPQPPITDRAVEGADLRTTAYLQPSKAFLEDIGVWARVAGEAAPLQVMRIVEASGEIPKSKDFDAKDISDLPFGWNLGNWAMRRGLVECLKDLANVTFLHGVRTDRVFTRTASAHASLFDGTRVNAQMIIAADGRDSPVRQALGIAAARREFGQLALAFAVTHAVPHNNISTEVHRSGGPFTLVPLPDFEGKPCSAVVWMDTTDQNQARMDLTDANFSAAATERSAEVLGPLTLASRRTAWPIISQLADRFCGERVALVAEAAHVLPPIGAQGLNVSLGDIATLLDLSLANKRDLGDAKMLAAYHANRHRAAQLRVRGVGVLNQASIASSSLLHHMRGFGLDALHGIAPLRRSLMRLGLGVR